MRTYAIAQAFIIALAVAWSAWYASRRLLPTASRRAQARVAKWLERSHAAWLRRLGRALRPVQTPTRGCGTSACSTCGACSLASDIRPQPVALHPRTKS
jgi:hypothetical protein